MNTVYELIYQTGLSEEIVRGFIKETTGRKGINFKPEFYQLMLKNICEKYNITELKEFEENEKIMVIKNETVKEIKVKETPSKLKSIIYDKEQMVNDLTNHAPNNIITEGMDLTLDIIHEIIPMTVIEDIGDVVIDSIAADINFNESLKRALKADLLSSNELVFDLHDKIQKIQKTQIALRKSYFECLALKNANEEEKILEKIPEKKVDYFEDL